MDQKTEDQIKAGKIAVEVIGTLGPSLIAKELGIQHRQTVHQWKVLPVEHLYKLEKLTGINRKRLRPDLTASGVWKDIK